MPQSVKSFGFKLTATSTVQSAVYELRLGYTVGNLEHAYLTDYMVSKRWP